MVNQTAGVTWTRPELQKMLPIYDLIADCVAGQEMVKSKGDKYLPRPNPSDLSDANKARYKAYLLRAVFYNVTNRTLEGLMGEIFFRDPEVELPDNMKPVEINANGKGLDLTQLSKQASKDVISFGRVGFLTDYPKVDGIKSVKQVREENIYPTVNVYKPWNCINWKTRTIGAKSQLSLVVLRESKEIMVDEFQVEIQEQYRVLKLDESNEYIQELWSPKKDKKGVSNVFEKTDTVKPVDSSGKPLTEIPFLFCGSSDNDVGIDQPPMYDMASLNIAHYRNSADYEEACYITGQPTPYFAGLTQNWVEVVFKNEPIQLGSRAAVPLPENATAGLLQAEANSMPYEAMQHKEDQMVAIGAKIVEESSVEKTATEVSIESSSESSILSSVVKNISSAIETSLKWGALLAGDNPDQVMFKLNDDFKISHMTAEERRMLLDEWVSGGISYPEYRENLRRNGIATTDDDEAAALIKKEQELRNQQNQNNNQQNKVDS